ncbi:hypothetical protein, partial [Escherichia coli]|uniref:hypothetical protein n=1 Tax=Escherichia coli TaxID=562 RepID=UPI0015E5B8C4
VYAAAQTVRGFGSHRVRDEVADAAAADAALLDLDLQLGDRLIQFRDAQAERRESRRDFFIFGDRSVYAPLIGAL